MNTVFLDEGNTATTTSTRKNCDQERLDIVKSKTLIIFQNLVY